MALVTRVSAATSTLLVALGLGIHPLMALLMVRLGLKQRVG
jgi:hypothetical protein